MANERKALSALLDAPEVKKGKGALSRRSHVEHAFEYFDRIELDHALHRGAVRDNAELAWLAELVAALAWNAYFAGRHTQVAFGKEVEKHAVRGRGTLAAASWGGEIRKGQFAERTNIVLDRMRTLTEGGKSTRAAAEIAAREGLGTFKGANLQLWLNHK